MAAEYCRKSGQIPAFGDWENANQLPITQYFECARQAGLLRCTCSGECGGSSASWGDRGGGLYGVGSEKPLARRVYTVPQRKTRGTNERWPRVKEQRKQVKVRELMDLPRHQPSARKHCTKHSTKSGKFISQQASHTVKPVDEDLYKIPSEFLENSKRYRKYTS